MKVFVIVLWLSGLGHSTPNTFDTARYEEGKKQFQLIQQKSEMPKYGICWKNAMFSIKSGCKHLSDEVQSFLALSYLNCFLALQGRNTYECEKGESIKSCTSHMADADRSSFTTMFTHTQNICYFLQAQIWHEEMDFTIDRLANSSSHVGQQLEESFRMQQDMIHQQNESLKNQAKIINQALDLRVLINDVFDRVSKLQSLVLGEFSGFYSIIYYMFSIILCYLLTSTPRTSGARFWLFTVMTVNMLLEQLVIIYTPQIFITDIPLFKDEEELIFCCQRMLRKISAIIGILILVMMACKYQDLNTLNSQLLIEIRRQNSDIKQMFLRGSVSPFIDKGGVDFIDSHEPTTIATADSTTHEERSSDNVSGYSSDNSDTTDINGSDNTYIIDHDADLSNTDSESLKTGTSLASNLSLLEELNHLRNSTPIRQMENKLSSWVNTGFYNYENGHGLNTPSTSGTSINKQSSRYNLRPRRGQTANSSSHTESPTSFHKTVKHLEKVARKNSRLSRAMLRRRQLNSASENE